MLMAKKTDLWAVPLHFAMLYLEQGPRYRTINQDLGRLDADLVLLDCLPDPTADLAVWEWNRYWHVIGDREFTSSVDGCRVSWSD